MEITSGRIRRPQKVVHYGPEGIGKTTLASQFPRPLFIDIEHGSAEFEVHRTPVPTSAVMLMSIIEDLSKDGLGYETLVIDTADWAERLFIAKVCSENRIKSLGGNDDFGRSFSLLETEFARFLDALSNLSTRQNMHLVVLAHAKMRKFELPEESGAFDRWELKTERKTSALLKEWPDMVLFGNYKTFVVDIKNSKKAQGGERVIYTTHHPCWDAKNRHGLPDEVSYDYESIAHCFSSSPATPEVKKPAEPEPASESEALAQLMQSSGVSESEVRQAVADNGYYPLDTPISKYTPDFIDGVLVAAWPKVLEKILTTRGS